MLRFQLIFVVAWLGLVVSGLALTAAAGQSVPAVTMAAWIALGCVPPIALVTFFAGPGSARMSKVIARSTRLAPTTAPERYDVIER